MIYQITYKDAAGHPLLEATLNADDARELLQIIVATPSLDPPPGTASIDVQIIPPCPQPA